MDLQENKNYQETNWSISGFLIPLWCDNTKNFNHPNQEINPSWIIQTYSWKTLFVEFPDLKGKEPPSDYFCTVMDNFIWFATKLAPSIEKSDLNYFLGELFRNLHQHGWRNIQLSWSKGKILFKINPKIEENEKIWDIVNRINARVLFIQSIIHDPVLYPRYLMESLKANKVVSTGMGIYTSKWLFEKSWWNFDINVDPTSNSHFTITIEKKPSS